MIDLPEYAVIGAASADLLTTELALSHEGFRELNPVMQTRPLRIGNKAVIVAGSLILSHELKKRGHKGWAKAVCWTVAGIWAGATAWNLKEISH